MIALRVIPTQKEQIIREVSRYSSYMKVMEFTSSLLMKLSDLERWIKKTENGL